MGLLKKIGKGLKKAAGPLGAVGGAAIGSMVGQPALGAKIGGSIGSSIAQGSGAKKAAKAQASELRNALVDVRGMQAPYVGAGTDAIGSINALNAGDFSGFENSPDRLAAMKFGTQAVERSAAGRGGLNSGNTLIDLTRFGQDNAAQYLSNYRNALFGQANIGQNAANNVSNAVLGVAGGVGDARASGIVGQTNALTGGIDQIAGALGDYYGSKKPRKPKINKNALYDVSTSRGGSYAV